MRCCALGCFADASDVTCAAHAGFFRFDTWIRSFGPAAYNRHTDNTLWPYIEYCLLNYVHDIGPEQIRGLYFAERDAFDEFEYEEGEGLVASRLLDYCRTLFRRPDVSPAWNKNLFHILVKQVLVNSMPHGLPTLATELKTLVGHPLVSGADVVELLARLRHSQPSPFAFLCSREAWQDILEALITPELVGMTAWAQTTDEEVRAWGATAVAAAVANEAGAPKALAQWRYETEPFLLDYCRLCRVLATERFDAVRDQLLATALHPDRGQAALLEGANWA